MLQWRFGECVVDPQRREVQRDGIVQHLPPKAYAVLERLIRERHRVVGRDELLESVWGHDALSPSVLGRTVMLARRSIGDEAAPGRWIRAVHGVGYRFVGDVHESRGQPAPRPADACGQLGRFAVLPCRNATGDASLDWTWVGLMALVERAMPRAGGAVLVPALDLLTALAEQGSEKSGAEIAWSLIERLDLAGVVDARLLRQGPSLWLEYQLYRRGRAVLGGALRGDDVVTLTERLADELSVAGQPARDPRSRSVGDPFLAQAWARGVELHSQAEYAAARPLLEIVCRASPDDAGAALLHLECLARLEPDRAEAAAAPLRERARRNADARLAARIETLLAGHGGRPSSGVVVRRSTGSRDQDWSIETAIEAACQTARAGRLTDACEELFALRAACQRPDRICLLARLDEALATIELVTGDLATARERLERVVEIERRQHARPRLARALSLLVSVHVQQGLFDRALARADEVLQLAGGCELPEAVIARVLVLHRECPTIAPLGLIEGLLPSRGAARLAALACLSLGRGDGEGARRLLHEALARGLVGCEPIEVHDWIGWWLRMEGSGGRPVLPDDIARWAGPLQVLPLLHASRLHAEAAAAWREEDLARASDRLESLVRVAPAGRERAMAEIDLATCLIELGRVADAAVIACDVGPWLREHPAGLALQARRMHAEGRPARARALQVIALDRCGDYRPPLQLAIASHYARCALGDARTALPPPRPSVLPSDAWRPWWPAPGVPAPLPPCTVDLGVRASGALSAAAP